LAADTPAILEEKGTRQKDCFSGKMGAVSFFPAFPEWIEITPRMMKMWMRQYQGSDICCNSGQPLRLKIKF